MGRLTRLRARLARITLLVVFAAAAALGPLLAPASGAAPGSASTAKGGFGRLGGTFEMRGRITEANGPPGEHVGEHIRRTWYFTPKCPTGQCSQVGLRRRRGEVNNQRLTLALDSRGHYSGRSYFFAPLRCGGTTYPLGEQVYFEVDVQITRATWVQHRLFATSLNASYQTRREVNRTRCVGALGGDAAVYSGHRTSPLPTPPTASFTHTSSSTTPTKVSFQDTSTPGRGNAKIVAWHWNFGDPASGTLNQSDKRDPVHTFRGGPGTYTVTLTVHDTLGLEGQTEQSVTIA